MKTIKLIKPILDDGKEVSELKMREITAGDIIKYGMPVDISTDSDVTRVNTKAIGGYISDLCNIPPSSVKSLSPQDFMSLTAEISGFFGTGQPT